MNFGSKIVEKERIQQMRCGVKILQGPRELRDLDRSLRNALGGDGLLEYSTEPWVDGLVVRIVYGKGLLQEAYALDEGSKANHITQNLKTLLSVPLTLTRFRQGPPVPVYIEVCGVVYREKEVFEAIDRRCLGQVSSEPKGPKDAVYVSMMHPDRRMAARTSLNMFCNEVASPHDLPCETHHQLMDILQGWGFRVNRPNLTICKGIEEVLDFWDGLYEKRKGFPYEIRGALCRINTLNLQRGMAQESMDLERGFGLAFKSCPPE